MLGVGITRKGYGLRPGLLKGVGDVFIVLPDFHFFATETKIHPEKIGAEFRSVKNGDF